MCPTTTVILMNKNIRMLAYVLLASLAFICIYLAFIPFHLSQVEKKSRNGNAAWLNDPRLLLKRQEVAAGSIYDRNGILLAQTVTGPEEVKLRNYPQGRDFSHVIGYSSLKYGISGLEARLASVLLDETGAMFSRDFFPVAAGEDARGNDIVLTLDASLQKQATALLNGKQGALVALEPATGKILALVSSPAFDPNNIDNQMISLKEDESSPLLNRATQGSYAPGSVFKMVTLTAALDNMVGVENDTFQCRGQLTGENFSLGCSPEHGQIDLKKAFAVSCNVAFAELGLDMGKRALVKTAEKFGFNGYSDFPIAYYPGKISGISSMNKAELALTAIGQGSVVANPMQMAVAASGVANGGKIMRPTLVDRVVSPKGKTLGEARPEVWSQVTSAEHAEIIKEYMNSVVNEGTGRRAIIPGLPVAGKTGTAENKGDPHAWFIGFAPVSSPKVVVAVIIENGGSGGAVAAPIAREIMRQAVNLD